MTGKLAAALAGITLAGALAALAIPDAMGTGEPQATISGTARVIDGDTIQLNATIPYTTGSPRIRLWGIDAPEVRQPCPGDPSCGVAARHALAEAIGDDAVTCTEVDRDRWDRVVARCRTVDGDLGSRMVAHGWAVDYRRYSGGFYQDQEAAAKAERLGVWRTPGFVNPEDWRRGKR